MTKKNCRKKRMPFLRWCPA